MSFEQAPNTSVVEMDTREDSYADHAFVSDANHFGVSENCTEAFHCPITQDIMIKPVVLVADGTTYEESALRDWLSENNISPLTGMELTTKQYHPNYALQQAINDYLTDKKKEQEQQNQLNELRNSINDDGYVGVGLNIKEKTPQLAISPRSQRSPRSPRSPKSIVSSDMELEDELMSYHSDDEKHAELLGTANTDNGGMAGVTPGGAVTEENNGMTLNNKNNNNNGTDIEINGEIDSKKAILDAKYDKLQIFLSNCNCNDYISIFIKEGFESIDDLYNIRLCDLFAIGVARGHARRLLNAIKEHKTDLARSIHNNNNNINSLQLGDPAMSIIDDGSIVDVSLIAGSETNTQHQQQKQKQSGLELGNENDNELKQSMIAQNNASIIIYPGKKILKAKNVAPLNVNVLLLGDAFVGKTSLRKRLETNEFIPTQTTSGVELTCLSGTYQEDDLQITIWDPAGQERYAPITKTFFRRAHGAAIVFSANDDSSWKHVTYWLNELETNAPDDIEVMLICNKVDLLFKDTNNIDINNNNNEEETKQNELEDKLIKKAIEVAAQKRIPFYMTSAKSGECVVQAFQELVSQIMINEGILQKIYEARDGVAMRIKNKNKNNNNNNNDNNTSNKSSKKNFGLLDRLREQRRKYQETNNNNNNSNGNFGSRISKSIIDLTNYKNDQNDSNRPMTSSCCTR